MKLVTHEAETTPRNSGFLMSNSGSADLDALRQEFRGYLLDMMEFPNMDLEEVYMRLSAFTARASYIRAQIISTSSKIWNAFRTGELDPFISECDRQFKVWSRVQSVNQMDFNATRGIT